MATHWARRRMVPGRACHALGKGRRGVDGAAAERWCLVPGDQERQLSPAARRRRDELERAIAEVRKKKTTLGEDEYYAQLEVLLVELARLYAAPTAHDQTRLTGRRARGSYARQKASEGDSRESPSPYPPAALSRSQTGPVTHGITS